MFAATLLSFLLYIIAINICESIDGMSAATHIWKVNV